MKRSNDDCKCINCKGIYTIVYRPGDTEAILQCQNCGKLWYNILMERIGFAETPDSADNYQIPITNEEFELIKKTKFEDLNLQFLQERKGRVIHEGRIVLIDSDFALNRCGKSVK